MTRNGETPSLQLDASRAEIIARAGEIVLDGWRSFDQARASEPALDADFDALLELPLPVGPTPALEVLEEAAAILDRSIAQPRPRYFAFIGSSGLPIGVVGDMLAACFDVNLATWAAAATRIEEQAVQWAAEFLGFPASTVRSPAGERCRTSPRSPPRVSGPSPGLGEPASRDADARCMRRPRPTTP